MDILDVSVCFVESFIRYLDNCQLLPSGRRYRGPLCELTPMLPLSFCHSVCNTQGVTAVTPTYCYIMCIPKENQKTKLLKRKLKLK